MFANHPAGGLMTKMGLFDKPKPAPAVAAPAVAVVLDAAALAEKKAQAILDAASDFTGQSLRIDVAAAVQEWCETAPADLDAGESMADRLLALIIGIADDNKDGDISEDEEAFVTAALETAGDYMTTKGVADADVLALLNDGDDDAAGRVLEFLKGALPEGDDAAMDDVDSFAFDDDSSASLFDCILDAVYKKKVVIRDGKKLRINKRVSGRVVLSGAQKVAIRKARRKAHSAGARMHRAKSMKIRTHAGL